MDDRYLYFALSDPDFFDVPWCRPQDDDLHVAPDPLGRWQRAESGPWMMLAPPDVVLPDAGWKIHISARPDNAQHVVDVVARICTESQVPWKLLRSAPLVRAVQHKYAPLTLSGKICTIYTSSDQQLAHLVGALSADLAGTPAPQIPGDHNHPDAPIGVRWGAFTEHWVESADGRFAPAVHTSGGAKHDDRRRPAPRPLPNSVAVLMTTQAPTPTLPIASATLVHRCNAGSLYRAKLTDGRTVALKEARHHVGLDEAGTDAVSRLRHEYDILQRLSGSGIAPEPIDYWSYASNDFLVMEWVEGGSMISRIGREHPLMRYDADPDATEAFWDWTRSIMSALVEVVRRMHDLGVAHGDLHPGNIIDGPDGPRLVDFESGALDGHRVTKAVGTPGYHRATDDVQAKDAFCLRRVRATLHDPDVSLLERRPDLAGTIARGIALDDPAQKAHRPMVTALRDTDELLELLGDGMAQRATPHRRDRLFPGGIEQFTSPLGGHNILSGAAGTLLALASAGRAPRPTHLDWLTRLPSPATVACRGLMEGVDGIALTLARLGRPEQALALIDARHGSAVNSFGWGTGRAGCAVALGELAVLTGRADLHEEALSLIRAVVDAVGDPTVELPAAGLMHGWSGIALALLRARTWGGQDATVLTEAATRCLHRELELLHPVGDVLVALTHGRLTPGLLHGSGGMALAGAILDRDHSATPDTLIRHATSRAARSLASVAAPVAGVGEGLAGAAAVLRAGGDDETACRWDERAAWHCVPTEQGWSTLGAQRLRCSDDLLTGSAGLLLALGHRGPQRLLEALSLPELPADDTCHLDLLPPATDPQTQIAVS
ncbi:protein kinase/lanthionine synthetase C family protein [Yimella sp. cx-51]|uniref:class III lanthionine synthetase LanKC N-terminal domain-containing protein n=1 Tax=Yimella sp. cx-51 TaxID=2770551 RepID=UPI00165DF6E1|nr:protein kinase/lanthionine synthetase C family protein [Yimella sp. cx-51]MBC9956531.1 protein kinase/lanthionine synthetase C family protein [Yimella sp. cx-51]QTH38365.1 protein kinase/lanthionine synthetase C family protein [Yimella sp. cx-51]